MTLTTNEPCKNCRSTNLDDTRMCSDRPEYEGEWVSCLECCLQGPKDVWNIPNPSQLSFAELRKANVARCLKWHPDGIESWSLADWFAGASGEMGELGGDIKCLNRCRDGLPGNKKTEAEIRANIPKEIADVIFYLDLLAAREGIDLSAAIRQKFNEVSERVGFPEKL